MVYKEENLMNRRNWLSALLAVMMVISGKIGGNSAKYFVKQQRSIAKDINSFSAIFEFLGKLSKAYGSVSTEALRCSVFKTEQGVIHLIASCVHCTADNAAFGGAFAVPGHGLKGGNADGGFVRAPAQSLGS